MADRLQGKTAIVTGAASGIGTCSALTMAREGAAVVVADRNGEGAEAVAAEIRDKGGRAVATATDIGEEDQIIAMIDAAMSNFGRLDVLHNNAALTDASMHAKDITVIDLDAETWDLSMRINARGAMLTCKHAVPHMIAGGGGSIINTASNQALSGDLSQTAYGAAKGAVVTLTMSVATACPPEILEVIEQSNLVPRLGEAEDIANLALFLASDESSYITGQVIRCDGGQLSHLPHFAYLMAASATTTRQ
jgi:NAD(P)-dependent dehydrogenase (short-subunit alcohol dehydrogenase family)